MPKCEKKRKKKQLSIGEMYINHYEKRVTNNKTWKKKTKRGFELLRVLHKNLRVSSVVKDVD